MITLCLEACPLFNHNNSQLAIITHGQQQLRSLNPNQTCPPKKPGSQLRRGTVPALAVSSTHIMIPGGGEAKVVCVCVCVCCRACPHPTSNPRSTLKLEIVAAPTRHHLCRNDGCYLPARIQGAGRRPLGIQHVKEEELPRWWMFRSEPSHVPWVFRVEASLSLRKGGG